MSATVNMHEAKTHLSRLVEKAERGEETIIARAGKPAARLIPIDTEEPKKRRLGILEGQGYIVPGDIKSSFKDEIEDMFYGSPSKFDDL